MLVIDFISLRERSTVLELQRSPSYYRIDVDVKTKNISIEIGVKVNSAVNTLDMPSETSSAIGFSV